MVPWSFVSKRSRTINERSWKEWIFLGARVSK